MSWAAAGNTARSDALQRYAATHGLPDAILAGNDQMGIAALNWMRARHPRPADVPITGFNAFEFWRYTAPKLTTARSPAYEMGAAAAAALLDRVRAGAFTSRELVFPVPLVDGDTA